MNIEVVKQRVAAIYANRDDDEEAHYAEDDLYAAFIAHVVQVGAPELAEMAAEVLKTKGIDFARWFA